MRSRLLRRGIGARRATDAGPPHRDELGGLTDFGLRVVGELEVPVEHLHVQHRTEWRMAETLPRRAIGESPFGDFARRYAADGRRALRRFRDTPYYAMWRAFAAAGYRVDWRTGERVPFALADRDILGKMRKMAAAFDSIERHGYLGGPFSSRPILVLEAPYEVQRFGAELEWRPYEIWSGHHRAACLAVLADEPVRTLLLEVAS